MQTPRREFLSLLGTGGVLAAAGVPPAAHPATSGDPYTHSDSWDFSWMKRVRGKARAVFDMPTIGTENGGWQRVLMWRQQAREVYGKDREVTTIAVIRHQAIVLAMNDAYWAEFKVGEAQKLEQGRGSGKFLERNPIGSAAADASERQKAGTLTGFIASGGIVLACGVAFGMIASRVGRANGLSGDAAQAKAKAYLIPGVILQPSGVFAMIAAQQLGCGALAAMVS